MTVLGDLKGIRRNGKGRAFKRKLNGFSYRLSFLKCSNCGYSCNADYNGAINILKQAMGYMPIAWASLIEPKLSMMRGLGIEEPKSPTLADKNVNLTLMNNSL